MKKNRFFGLLMAAVTLFSTSFMTSCEESEEQDSGTPSVVLTPATLTFDAFGEPMDDYAGEVTIKANRDWVVEVPAAIDWLTIVGEASGSNNGSVKFSVSENTGTARSASVNVKLYNGYGTLLEETLTVSQASEDGATEVVAGTATFDGSELPTLYGTDPITVDGTEFAVGNVANFSSAYDVQGPIQFQKGGSYIYNTAPFGDLKSVVILLAPKGSKYNNFKVYGGTEANPADTAIEFEKSGDIITCTIPEGTTYVSIKNDSDYTAYAFQIEFLCGDDKSTAADFNYDAGGDDKDDSEYTYEKGQVTLDGDSGLPTEPSATDAQVTVAGIEFTYKNSYYSQYNSVTTDGEGYIYNTTPMKDLTKVVVCEDYKYYNYTLYAGTAANPAGTAIEYEKIGNYYVYTIPAGSEYIKFTNESEHSGQGDTIDFYFTSDNEGGDDKPDTGDDLPTYEYNDVIKATDYALENDTEVPDAIFGTYKLEWSKGSHTNSVPKYFTTGSAARIYAGNTLTISTTDGSALTTIAFKYVSPSKANFSASVGTIDDNGNWSGDATSVVFTSLDDAATSTKEQTHVVSITINGDPDTGDDTTAFEYVAGDLTLGEASGFPTKASATDAVVATGGASFVVNNIYFKSDYKSLSSASGSGSFYNLTAFEGLTQVVITEDYKFYNFTLCAGAELNPTTEVEYTKVEGADTNYYVYDIPAGSKYVTIINKSTYSASADLVDFYYDSLGDTADFDAPDPVDIDALLAGQTLQATVIDTHFGTKEANLGYISGDMEINGYGFACSSVANYGSGIQMNTSKSSSAHNTTAVAGLSSVVITLNPDKSSNGFVLYAGNAANPTETAIEPVCAANVCLYAIPAGSEFVTITAKSGAAYATSFEMYTK